MKSFVCWTRQLGKKNVFATSIRFLFSFAIWGFLHIINNLLIIRLLVKQTGGASKFFYSVITLMTHDTLSKMKGVIHLTMIQISNLEFIMLTLKDFHALGMFLQWHGARTNTTVPGLCKAPYFALTAIENAITLVLIMTSSA